MFGMVIFYFFSFMLKRMIFKFIGSSGGKGSSGVYGGCGGGILFLNISDILDIEGILSVDGVNNGGFEVGGGSVGSILIRIVLLEGSGIV